MEFYQTTQTVRLPAGIILLLNAGQFNARAHLLEPKVDGFTIAKEPVEFKAGEIIGLEHVPLALKTSLEPVEFEDGEHAELFAMRMLGTDDFNESENVTDDDGGNAADAGDSTESLTGELLDISGPGYPLLPAGDVIEAKGDVIDVEKTTETESVIDESADNGDSEAKEDACADGLGTDQTVVYDKPVTTKPSKKQAK
jgi:hypothetical protein